MKTKINECIIVHKKMGDTVVMAKNRDRAYKPEIEIVHEFINGVEVVYLHDILTDWSEGMNEYGVGIVNTALMVTNDENEKKIIKKTGKKSKDGVKIRESLGQRTFKDSILTATNYLGGIKGHTFISTSEKFVSIETTSKHNPKFKIHSHNSPTVRTNHGEIYKDAGYKEGENLISSKIRKKSAEYILKHSDNTIKLLKGLRTDLFDVDSNFNMTRKTDKMLTSSQLLLNLTDMIFELNYFNDRVEKFHGIKVNLPDDYDPVIQIKVNKL